MSKKFKRVRHPTINVYIIKFCLTATEPLIRLPSVVYENIGKDSLYSRFALIFACSGKMKDDRWLGTDYAERMRYSLRYL